MGKFPKRQPTTTTHPPNRILDARFQHPFTCIVAGPTGTGKSTFVRNLLNNQHLIDVQFDYIFVFLGTAKSENRLLSDLPNTIAPEMKIFELNTIYDKKQLRDNFPHDFHDICHKRSQLGLKGCVIFDDLMRELTDNDMICDLFTKLSSHLNISTIFISQNLFHAGSKPQMNTTIFRNTKILVIFDSPLDVSSLQHLARKMGVSSKRLQKMFSHIFKKHRYVVIRQKPHSLRFTSDIFAQNPRSMRAYKMIE